MITCSTATLTEQLAAARRTIDRALDRYSDLPTDCPTQLREAIRYSLLAPGKRLRPMLVLLAAEACGGTSGSGAAGGLRRGNDPHVFADSRRSAGDGRRRSAPRPADVPQGIRRSGGNSGRRRAVDAGLRSAGQRHSTVRSGGRVAALLGRSGRRHGTCRRTGRRSGGRIRGRRSGNAGIDPSPQDRRDVFGFAAIGRLRGRRRSRATNCLGTVRPKTGPGFPNYRRLARRARRRSSLGKTRRQRLAARETYVSRPPGNRRKPASRTASHRRGLRGACTVGTATAGLEALARYVLERNH